MTYLARRMPGALACMVALVPGLACAAAGLDAIDTNLSLRGDGWSGARGIDDAPDIAHASAWGQARVDLGAAGKLVGDGWLQAQTGTEATGPHGRVRELYWRYSAGPLEVKVGRQLVIWGRADGLNPTDKLSPRDFTLLVPEDSAQRHGNEAVQLGLASGYGNVSALWFPHGASHTLPLKAIPNVHYQTSVPRHAQWALKWDATGDGVDGSLSYFNGVDPMPDLQLSEVRGDQVTVAVANHRTRMIGADVSIGSGKLIWRAEAAWTHSDSAGTDDFTRKKDQFGAVGGPDLSFGESSTVGIQATLQRVPDFRDPDSIAHPLLRAIAWQQAAVNNQTSRTQKGMTLRLASRWLNDALAAETSAVVLWPGAPSGVWRTKVNYAIDDHWSAQAGSERYFGSDHSVFGQLGRKPLLYVQLRYGI